MVIKFGIIGAGRMGTRHIEALTQVPDAKVIGIFDVIPELVQKVGNDFNIKVFKDLIEICSSNEIDAITICTPNHLHLAPAMEAISNNKHIFLEKPMATTIEDCIAIIKAQQNKKIKIMIGHTHRFYPIHQKAKSIIDSDQLGRLKIVSIIGINPGFLPGVNKQPEWFLKKEARSGVFMLDAIHYIDLKRWWFNDEIKEILPLNAISLTNVTSIENLGSFSLKLNNGGSANIVVNNASTGVLFSRFSLIFEKGVVESDFTPSLRVGTDKWSEEKIQFNQYPNKTIPLSHNLQGFVNKFTEFVDCIISNKKPQVSVDEGKKNVEYVLNLYEKLNDSQT